MKQHTATAPLPESAVRRSVEKDYVAEVTTLWQELAHAGTPPNTTELAAALATRLGLPVGAAQGVLQGFQQLLHYALQESAAGSTALEEERQSVQVALATARPVARLQQRLEAVEARTPEIVCGACGRRCAGQGRRRRPGSARSGSCPCSGAMAGARRGQRDARRRTRQWAYRRAR